MLRSIRCSRGSTNVIATPSRPARPVRPIRCTYACGDSGLFSFPEAGTAEDGLTIDRLREHWPALFVVVPFGVAMFGWDMYSLYRVGQLDRIELEKHFDEAEYWLRSRTAHVVRVVTFGFINPRRLVAQEVEKALLAVSDMLNFTLWWVILQMALRFCFGLSLWLTWALTP